jgi:hypothetical protein
MAEHPMDDRTASLLQTIVTAAFFGTWIVLGVVGVRASRKSMAAAARRRSIQRGAIVGGGLFAFFTTTLAVLDSRSWSSLRVLLVVVPAVVLIGYLGIKFTIVCDKCGATLYNHDWFTPMRFCSKCGAELATVKTSQDDSYLE